MKRPISILSIMIVGIMSAVPSDGVQMTAQIRRLLDQKEEKIKQLEKCEGKKKAWMIAGISTIGLTAVGVGVNIVQANKSKDLSEQIESAERTLEQKQAQLERIQAKAAAEEKRKNTVTPRDNEKDAECACEDCKKTLTINSIKYTCGKNADYGEFAEESKILYVCKEGCWRGYINPIDYTNIPDCESEPEGGYVIVSSGYSFYFNAMYVNADLGDVYDIKFVCKSKVEQTAPDDEQKETTKKDEKTQTSETPEAGRIDNAPCLTKDLPTHATVGHYITYGINNLLCYTRDQKGTVKCSCAADICEDKYELARDANGNKIGNCSKKKETTVPPTTKHDTKGNDSKTKNTDQKKDTTTKKDTQTGLIVTDDGVGQGYYEIDGSDKHVYVCAVSNPGDWCVKFDNDNNIVKGVSACSDVLKGDKYSIHSIAAKDTEAAFRVSVAHDEIGNNGTKSPQGPYCYCWVTDVRVENPQWVYVDEYTSASHCANMCSWECGDSTETKTQTRRLLFGVEQ